VILKFRIIIHKAVVLRGGVEMEQNVESVPEGDNMWLFMRDVRETMKDQNNKVVSKKVRA